MSAPRKHQRGVTLIELIVALVVIGICVVGALGLLTSLSMRSAAAMNRTQAVAIAESYLTDILSRSYVQVQAYAAPADPRPRDAWGALIAGSEAYRVQIFNNPATLGNAPNTVAARQITVVVTDPSGATTRVTGYRTNYAGQVLFP